MENEAPSSGLRGSLLGNILVIGGTLAVLFGVWYFMQAGGSGDSVEVETGTTRTLPAAGMDAPDFSAENLAGETITKASLQAKPTWFVFMASWCQACRAELDEVKKFQADHPEVNVVGVFLQESPETVKDFAERTKLNFQLIPDPAGKLSSAYGVRSIPSHVFMAPDGKVWANHLGGISASQIADIFKQR